MDDKLWKEILSLAVHERCLDYSKFLKSDNSNVLPPESKRMSKKSKTNEKSK